MLDVARIEPAAVEGAVSGDGAEHVDDGTDSACGRGVGGLHHHGGGAHAEGMAGGDRGDGLVEKVEVGQSVRCAGVFEVSELRLARQTGHSVPNIRRSASILIFYVRNITVRYFLPSDIRVIYFTLKI